VISVTVFLIVLGIFVGSIAMIGRWILTPIDRAGEYRNVPLRFSIGDFLCLFIVLQVPLLFTHFVTAEFFADEERHAISVLTLLTWIIAPVIWFKCARAISKAGVDNGRHRFVFLGLIIPVVYYGLVPFLYLTAANIGWLLSIDERPDRNPPGLSMLAWFVLALVYYLSGLFSRWMLRQGKRDTESRASTDRTTESELVS
jgi:hypothetical protein